MLLIFFLLFNVRGYLNLNIFKYCILNIYVYIFDWLGGGGLCVKVKLNKNLKWIWIYDLFFISIVFKLFSYDDV